jgi:S1-C subfamily serine protease
VSVEPMTPRELFEKYSEAVIFLSIELPTGELSIGSAFHVGDGVFVTARHVVDSGKIVEVGSTVGTSMVGAMGRIVRGPLFHPNKSVDLAVLVVEGFDCPAIPLGGHFDDWINDEQFMLRQIIVMGYPPIPLSSSPVLVVSRGEVNAVIDRYIGKHPHFIVSAMARGGFSGGPCLIESGFALGVVTEALVQDYSSLEVGYMSVLSIEPVYDCLEHYGLLPAAQAEGLAG